MGLTFAEAGRAFLEVAFEKTVDHDLLGSIVTQTGHHERLLVGGRIAATAMARMERQARPYMSYGLANNKYRVDGIGMRYEATGIGLYAGLGVEFPFAQKSSLSFDTRYHTWSDTDTTGYDGKFACVSMSLLWLGRF
jgi:hypothetical protein